MAGPGGCAPFLCTVDEGVKVGVEDVEIIQQDVYGADGACGDPVVCDVLQVLPNPPGVSIRIEAIQLVSVLSLGCCDGFPQSILCSFVLCRIA